ncbi:unnamed protein product [Heterotrigona itama]|uniref:Uncharacterized protein n=1 Tax=Heterotrigona itama TaxID=395501 RepID=A0A6V7H4J0_9HYME|nr:unnamed protein product [Heterotrigona itama]
MASEARNDGQAVMLRYPSPEVFTYPYCYAGNSTAQMKGSGVYKLHGSLAKHLKHHHPSSSQKWVCSECSFTDSGACPYKAVKLHFEKIHASGQSTLRLQRRCGRFEGDDADLDSDDCGDEDFPDCREATPGENFDGGHSGEQLKDDDAGVCSA